MKLSVDDAGYTRRAAQYSPVDSPNDVTSLVQLISNYRRRFLRNYRPRQYGTVRLHLR